MPTVRSGIPWLLLCALGMTGCSPEAPPPGPETHSRDYLQALLIDRNWPEWPRYFAAEATVNGSTLALQIMRGTADGLHFAFSGLALEVLDQVARDDAVATRFVISGQHDGRFECMEATHRPVALEGYVFDRFDDHGRIIETHMLLDLVGLSRQIGGGPTAH